MPIVEPPGGHAIYIDAGRMLPHILAINFPDSLSRSNCIDTRESGRVEIGTVMFGEKAQHELLRLAIPRRVYTQSHIDYLVEAILEVNAGKTSSKECESPASRNFSGTSQRDSSRSEIRRLGYN